MSGFEAGRNLGQKATRRLLSAHKPIVRALRRRARAQEHEAFARQAQEVSRQIADLARGKGPIVVGPWLAEVGYEVLYWVPFLRWFADAHGVARERLVVLSRGGLDDVYRGLAGTYVDIFDLMTPEALAARNAERRASQEGGGQKQSGLSPFDEELLEGARARAGVSGGAVLHPSLMFRLFREVWHGNLPMDLLWTHVRHAAAVPARRALPPGLPQDFIAARFYGGPALGTSSATRAAARALVEQAASIAPVVLLDPDLSIDEHRDFDLRGIPGVTSAAAHMTPRTNLGVQVDLIARSRLFLGTCGGLAWFAPFLGTPTVAVYDSDQLLAPHLFVARQAGVAAGAAAFTPLDLRALAVLGLPAGAGAGASRPWAGLE